MTDEGLRSKHSEEEAVADSEMVLFDRAEMFLKASDEQLTFIILVSLNRCWGNVDRVYTVCW